MEDRGFLLCCKSGPTPWYWGGNQLVAEFAAEFVSFYEAPDQDAADEIRLKLSEQFPDQNFSVQRMWAWADNEIEGYRQFLGGLDDLDKAPDQTLPSSEANEELRKIVVFRRAAKVFDEAIERRRADARKPEVRAMVQNPVLKSKLHELQGLMGKLDTLLLPIPTPPRDESLLAEAKERQAKERAEWITKRRSSASPGGRIPGGYVQANTTQRTRGGPTRNNLDPHRSGHWRYLEEIYRTLDPPYAQEMEKREAARVAEITEVQRGIARLVMALEPDIPVLAGRDGKKLFEWLRRISQYRATSMVCPGRVYPVPELGEMADLIGGNIHRLEIEKGQTDLAVQLPDVPPAPVVNQTSIFNIVGGNNTLAGNTQAGRDAHVGQQSPSSVSRPPILVWRILLRSALVFACLGGAVVLCAWRWGVGENPWQKITQSWQWLAAVFAISAIVYRFLLERDRSRTGRVGRHK
jgi:hypothetical protein